MAIPQLANITSPPYPTASCDPPARQPSHSPSKIWKYILKIYQYTITIWNSLFCKFNSLLKLVNNCSTISNLRFIMICFLIWIVLAMFHQSMDKCPVSMALDNVYDLWFGTKQDTGAQLSIPGLVVGVLSSRSNFMQRLAVRNTWAATLAHQKQIPARLVFVIGEEDCHIIPKLRKHSHNCELHQGPFDERWISMEESEKPISRISSECTLGLGVHVFTDVNWQGIIIRGISATTSPKLWLKYGEDGNELYSFSLQQMEYDSDWFANNINVNFEKGAQIEIIVELPENDCTYYYKDRGCAWDDGGGSLNYAYVRRSDGSVSPWTPDQCVPFQLLLENGRHKCPSGWQLFDGQCYYFSSASDRRSWADAKKACNDRYESQLASVHSMHENDFLGESDLGDQYHMWIGLESKNFDWYEWDDKSDVSFTNWDRYEPNNKGGNEQCVEMMPHNSKWNDNHCSQKHPYVCKKKRNLRSDSRSSSRDTTDSGDAAWQSERASISNRLLHEQTQYKDLLYVSGLVDTYSSLPYKLKALIQWSSASYPGYWLLKTDDDTLVDVARLFEVLQTVSTEARPAVYSQFQRLRRVPRFGKWAEYNYPGLTFPDYPIGSGYLVTGSVISALASSVPHLRCYQGEDTSMGVWLSALTVPEHSATDLLLAMTMHALRQLQNVMAALSGELLLAKVPGEHNLLSLAVSPHAEGSSPALLVSVPCWVRSPACNTSYVVAPDLSMDNMVALHADAFR